MKNIKNVRVTNIPVIDFDELQCEFEVPMSEYSFYNRADQSDGYFWFGTDEDDMAFCEQEIQEYRDYMVKNPDVDFSDYIRHLQNDLELIKTLREAGYNDGVLIYIWY